MKLSNTGLKDRQPWIEAGYDLPTYDREAMIAKTKAEPTWIHFGAGNLFKAYQANVVETLLNEGVLDRGLIAVEGFDEAILQNFRDHDTLALLATLKSDGNVQKTVIGSIAESVFLDPKNETEFARMKEIFRAPSLQMASFTITEKGYALTNAAGETLEPVKTDFEQGPAMPVSYLGKVCALLLERYNNGKLPIAMVSMDNCSHNGEKLKNAIMAYVKAWNENGFVSDEFVQYVDDENQVSFPWSMIDKITPRPDDKVSEIFKKDGVEDMDPVKTSRGSFVAPFVNAEETEYLVIEDQFPNGRPALEKGGLIFTDRETVNKVETMKVTTCLNPLHTALAVFGCLLDYTLISAEMQDADLVGLIKAIGYKEGLPVVINPGILDPKEFIDTVINVRFPNPFMPDAPQRIATDTSQKLSVRFGETIKSYAQDETLDPANLEAIPLVFAGWLRYLMQINDNGNRFEASADPLLDELYPLVSGIQLGDVVTVEDLKPILTNAKVFGIDLIEYGMADKVVALFNQMNAKEGAIRSTLHEVVEKVSK
ncbi:mannitol dehydrogenase family protein [uncultured Dubosiella sp.]|uniref:mannitol dehydrogenase family protein n=1 Tax=uncultured Dubosiella sp. TaxID=1937011 RepID=UPI00272FC8EA|nr:mannitol dehydrogenase family protein [uncultured Dubosiella sp.]